MKSNVILLLIACVLCSCKSGPFNLIKPASPHQQYQRKLTNAGLDRTAMGITWIKQAEQSLQRPLAIKIPYQEQGYFSAAQPTAVALKFKVTKGQKLNIGLNKKPADGFMIYVDLWRQANNQQLKLLASADTLGNPLQIDADETEELVLRVQPELLGTGAYTLQVNIGPSLAYPLKSANRNQIQSLYGVGRDGNTRKHEGVDIFAPFRTPVVAVAPGTVTRVNMNNLGGKVVWLRPDGKDYTLYYAHLDEQSVTEGQLVLPGDTLGRMGNTGNARNTAPHLHFGIYTSNGTVDPLPYINPEKAILPQINSDTKNLNATMRTNARAFLGEQQLATGTIVQVNAASSNEYRVQLPNGEIGYLTARSLTNSTKPIRSYKIRNERPVYDRPDTSAAVKLNLKANQTIEVLGSFGNFQLVLDQKNQSGWILKEDQ